MKVSKLMHLDFDKLFNKINKFIDVILILFFAYYLGTGFGKFAYYICH